MSDHSHAGPPDTPIRALAYGRIVLGSLALAAPGALARLFGAGTSPQLEYMTRIFGSRAIALGLGYLTCPPAERRRWRRLGLMVDASDTLTGLGQVLRGRLPSDFPLSAALALLTMTGGYFTIGAFQTVRDTRRHTTQDAGRSQGLRNP